jgi:histidine ammonia-lyase
MNNIFSIEIHHKKTLAISDVVNYARNPQCRVTLSTTADFQERIVENRLYLEKQIQNGADIYGVTTGFGDSSRNRLEASLASKLQRNLYSYHGCGVGPYLSEEACAASLLVRLNCITRGFSGVSWELVKALSALAHHRIFPAIPAQGSVGASGDLTPLSYIAASLAGERFCYVKGKLVPSAEALKNADLPTYEFRAKEALALMNGTSVMTAIASLAWNDAQKIAEHACALTALLVECLESRTTPFLRELHEVKPHQGQLKAADLIFKHLQHSPERSNRKDAIPDAVRGTRSESHRLQDSYSIRCAPQVIGVLFDVLDWTNSLLNVELNSVNDNPVIRDELDLILNGGHFFGGHVAAACDALKTSTANVLNLIDKQMGILLDARLNDGRFANNLVATAQLGVESHIHHSFKAMQISLSALTAEALKTSIPMSIFSRPTECLNQDVVSMGTIAARDLANITEMGRSVVAIYAMALRQAVFLLESENRAFNQNWSSLIQEYVANLTKIFQPVLQDRALDGEIVAVTKALFAGVYA